MNVKVLPSSKIDIRQGIYFYEKQEPGLGAYFLDSISADIDSIQLFAGIHPFRRLHYRFLSNRFPFWIYYRKEKDVAYVVAVLDARQDPESIVTREKLEESQLYK